MLHVLKLWWESWVPLQHPHTYQKPNTERPPIKTRAQSVLALSIIYNYTSTTAKIPNIQRLLSSIQSSIGH